MQQATGVQTRNRAVLWPWLIGTAVLVAFLIFIESRYGWANVLGSWRRLSLPELGLALTLVFGTYAVRAARIYDYFHNTAFHLGIFCHAQRAAHIKAAPDLEQLQHFRFIKGPRLAKNMRLNSPQKKLLEKAQRGADFDALLAEAADPTNRDQLAIDLLASVCEEAVILST